MRVEKGSGPYGLRSRIVLSGGLSQRILSEEILP